MKRLFERLFCKHDYKWCRKIDKFFLLSGERQYLVCMKCGKVKDTRFFSYE